MAATTVTSKGQVTIPKVVRDDLDIKPGTKVMIESLGGGEAILRKVRIKEPRPDRFDRAIGSAEIKWHGTTDEYMTLIRGYDEDDPGLR
ncbi:MAG: AbrB/MazE/SpoVT family DNA-binding domain-containing protein [Terracidiphilus sp.]